MNDLYPLKFNPIYKEKIWGGGNRLTKALGKDSFNVYNCGESWELSAVEENVSVVSNGFLQGNNLTELIEVYMGDLVGDRVYEKFGVEFPLLFKYIDTKDDLSIQVHPDDETAKKRHKAYGKTEMWYVVDASEGAMINSGFNQTVTQEQYLEYLEKGKITDILCYEKVIPGDVFFIPAGRVHSLGKEILVAEIQQTSDITYRIYDYGRKDENEKLRDLHNDLAIDAIDFQCLENYKTKYKLKINEPSKVLSCDYFTVNILSFTKEIERDYNRLDSFVVYMNLNGHFLIEYDNGKEEVKKGETILIPANLELLRLIPRTESVKILEVYIPN